MANKDTSKLWFQTGDYPTEAQFAQVLEWLRWKDEQLAISDVAGLATILNNISVPSGGSSVIDIITLSADGYYQMTAGTIVSGIIIDTPEDIFIQIGTTPGGSEIAEDVAVTGGSSEPITLLLYAKAARNIYFSNVLSTFTVIILKQIVQ